MGSAQRAISKIQAMQMNILRSIEGVYRTESLVESFRLPFIA